MSIYSRLDRIAADVEKLDKQVKSVSNAPQSQRTSVEGGSIDFNDADGNLKAIVGAQDDGGTTVNVIAGPTPPTPINYTVTVDHGSLTVHWDGEFENDAVAPTDWARWTAYAQPGEFVVPERSTAIGGTDSASGGEVTAGVLKGQWTVTVLAWSQAGKPSAMGLPVTVDVPGYGDIVLAEIDAAETLIKNAGEILVTEQGTLGEKLAESDAALDALEVSLGELDETTLPALRNDLDAAEGRLDSAEGQITDAFGELALVPGKITDATQDALILAATDAQARADAAQAAADEAARAYAEAIATGIEPVDLDALRDHMATKAAQAKQAAIDAAALDATAKANAAKSQAQAWDEALSTSINNTIDTARTELEGDISAAQSTATQALTSANTKNKVTRSTSRPPASYDGRVDDVWFTMSSMGSGGRVLFQEMWNGNTWVSVTIDSQVIAYLDAAKITTGHLNVAGLIEAGAITVDKLLVGVGQNLVPDPSFSNSTMNDSRVSRADSFGGSWSIADGMVTLSAPSGLTANTAFTLSATADRYSWPTYAGAKVSVRFQARARSGSADVRGIIFVKKRNGSTNVFVLSPSSWVSVSSQWVDVVGSYTMADDDVAYSTSFQVRSTSVGVVDFRAPFSASMVGSTVIEPGAVTTDKLAANVLEVGNLKAGTAAIASAVVQKIAAQTASIQTADIKNLFVTGTASLSNVVAERIAAETAKFIELEVGNLVAGTGTMDTATINKLFTDVVVAGMSIATEFIGENAILTGAVTAPKITASEELWAKIGEFVKIRAEQLEADAIDGMVITGPNIRTAASGARVQLDAGGLSVYDSLDDWQVRLTPDGSSFKGDLEAESLVANGAAEFKSTDNMLAQGAKLTLAAGVTDPTAPPIVQPYWDGIEFDPPSGFVPAGLAFDGTYYWTATLGELYDGGLGPGRDLRAIRIHGTTGEVGTITVSQDNPWGVVSVWGATCIGSELFWLCQVHKKSGATLSPYFAAVIVTNLSGVEVRRFEYPELGYGPGNPLTYKPGIGNDGTNVVIAQCDDAGLLRIRIYNKTTGVRTAQLLDDGNTRSDITGVHVGNADWGRKLATVMVARTSELLSFSPTTGVYDGDATKFNAAATGSTGVVFVDGKFRTLDSSGTIHEYADKNTGDGSGDWWCACRWETDTDSDGTIDYRSKISPPARFTWPRRARLKATGQPKPVGVEAMAGFLAKKSTKPARTDFKRNYTGYSKTRSIAYWDWYQNTGDAPADGNTYPTATPSSITSASGTFQVNGDGSGKWGPLTFNTDGTIRGATAAGEAIVPINAANSNRTLAVTFATGRFKTPPIVVATPATPDPQTVQVSVNNITATGFTMVARRTVASNAYVQWVATEG